MQVDSVFDKLFTYFDVSTMRELADKMEVSYSSITKWKNRNAINAIKKRCRELKIFDEIFGQQFELINTVNVQNINRTLFIFRLRILVYLYMMFKESNIRNLNDFEKWNQDRELEPAYKRFIKDFRIDFKNDLVSLPSYREETVMYLDYFLTVDEQEYLFSNSEQFESFLFWAIKEKR